jgi:hypothetical protein
MRMPSSSGPIATAKVNTLVVRYARLLERGTAASRLNEQGSATSSARKIPESRVCSKSNPGVELTWTRHILQASRRLINLDDKQVDAVAARIELDLRIGYAFTRFLTLNLRPLGGAMSELTLSYGE